MQLMATDRYVDEEDTFFERTYRCLATAIEVNEENVSVGGVSGAERTSGWHAMRVAWEQFEEPKKMTMDARAKVMNRF